MRFAIALLTVICIASAIGTVVKQGEPWVSYVDQFGPFWAEVFGALGLYRIYSSGWFLTILAFLVVSTSLCIARNAPKILADWRTHKEHIREQALQAFHHRAAGTLEQPLAVVQTDLLRTLARQGWSVKLQRREASARGEAGVMLGARLGAANKLGYLAAHGAIVLICLGGLFDGDLVIRAQVWAQKLQPFKGGNETERGRLSEGNPAYRAQLFVPEGTRSNAAVVNLEQGMLVQPLPFDIELKKFSVDYYATGMPKRFASDIVIHDARKGVDKAVTVEVNHPVVYDGVTIFQSSFEDGGSSVQLKPLRLDVPMAAATSQPLPSLGATVGGQPQALPAEWVSAGALPAGQQGAGPLQLEVTGLRVINVEDLAQAQKSPVAADGASSGEAGTDVRGVNLAELSKHLGSGAKPAGSKQLVNIGPSVIYKLRDAAGQAREYQNYMAPVKLDGQQVFLFGVRDTPAEGFRYLRVPADEDQSVQGWLRLRQALNDAAMRAEAARRFARMAAPADRADLQSQLATSAQRALDLFAGAVPVKPGVPSPGGLQALSDFIEQAVPVAQREHTSATLVRILNGGLFELLNLSRERAGVAPLSPQQDSARTFMTASVLSLSDAMFYPVPLVLVLEGFVPKQASVFQVTRTPGRNVVYLGCVLLIIGVFAMLYIRERRLWVWLQDDGAGGTRVKMALSSTRQTLDTDREFERLQRTVLGAAAHVPPASGTAA
ncbi:MAG: cytochrome c biogenesis protein ResB [Proteobacteria bacterium]|nr:cytochrome c biogenesis protein ResB [Pseudomonadota bacterium]